MNRTQSVLVKILLSLFLLNTLSLCLYFSTHHQYHHKSNGKPHSSTENHSQLTVNHSNLTENRGIYLKPWPILPSYLPWTQTPNVLPRSCEAYFGNGFTRRLDVLPPSTAAAAGRGGGWFRCFYSETLRSSVCEGGSVRMVPERVKMASGGERLEDVIGRGEDVELPDFEFGAFEVLGLGSRVSGRRRKERKLVDDEFLNSFLPRGDISKHTMRGLVRSFRIVDRSQFQCDQVGKSRAFVFN